MERVYDLQRAVGDLLARIADLSRSRFEPPELQTLFRLHEELARISQQLAFADEERVDPGRLDAAFAEIAETGSMIEAGAPNGVVLTGISNLVTTISALPGKPVTSGGGPISN